MNLPEVNLSRVRADKQSVDLEKIGQDTEKYIAHSIIQNCLVSWRYP